jgi:hypothetical protein
LESFSLSASSLDLISERKVVLNGLCFAISFYKGKNKFTIAYFGKNGKVAIVVKKEKAAHSGLTW